MMICNTCGGTVEWIGPVTNFTGTKCLKCGAENNHRVDSDECPDCGNIDCYCDDDTNEERSSDAENCEERVDIVGQERGSHGNRN